MGVCFSFGAVRTTKLVTTGALSKQGAVRCAPSEQCDYVCEGQSSLPFSAKTNRHPFRWCKLGIFNPGKNIGIVWYIYRLCRFFYVCNGRRCKFAYAVPYYSDALYEYYDVLKRVHVGHDVASGRALYYEGRICDSKPFLEKFRHCETDEEYLAEFNKEYDDLMLNVMEAIPDIRMRLQKNKRTGKIELGADVQSVFDIAWYTFARLVADVAPPIDKDMDYFESQGSILTCMACGEYFVRHSSRQRYCNNPNCQAERNNRKARAYYERKKEQQ